MLLLDHSVTRTDSGSSMMRMEYEMSADTSTSAARRRPAALSSCGSLEFRPDASTTRSAATSRPPLSTTPARRRLDEVRGQFCKRASVAKQHTKLSQEPAPAYKGPETARVTDAMQHVLLGLWGARRCPHAPTVRSVAVLASTL